MCLPHFKIGWKLCYLCIGIKFILKRFIFVELLIVTVFDKVNIPYKREQKNLCKKISETLKLFTTQMGFSESRFRFVCWMFYAGLDSIWTVFTYHYMEFLKILDCDFFLWKPGGFIGFHSMQGWAATASRGSYKKAV